METIYLRMFFSDLVQYCCCCWFAQTNTRERACSCCSSVCCSCMVRVRCTRWSCEQPIHATICNRPQVIVTSRLIILIALVRIATPAPEIAGHLEFAGRL